MRKAGIQEGEGRYSMRNGKYSRKGRHSKGEASIREGEGRYSKGKASIQDGVGRYSKGKAGIPRGRQVFKMV